MVVRYIFSEDNFMSNQSHFCPLLSKKVKIKGDLKAPPKNLQRHSAICQNNRKECDGNCQGCMILINN